MSKNFITIIIYELKCMGAYSCLPGNISHKT